MKAELRIQFNDKGKMVSGYKFYSDNEEEKHSLRLILLGELQTVIQDILDDDKPFRKSREMLR